MKRLTKRLVGEEYTITHRVGLSQRKVRLDQFVMELYRHRSRERLKNAIMSGGITIVRNGSKHLSLGKVKPSTILQKGDVIHVRSVKRKEPDVNFDYKILFEDDDIAVVLKPPNLPVHPSGRFFFNTLLVHMKTEGFNPALENEKPFYLVHRIDKETSGILLLAKNSQACAVLTSQFKQRETGKYYLAITHGVPTPGTFTIDQPIGKVAGSRIGLKMYPVSEKMGGLPSLTEFELVEAREGFSLLACFPKTGRQHQIRVHAELAGVPLVGDKIYGLSDEEGGALMDGNRINELEEDDSDDAAANFEGTSLPDIDVDAPSFDEADVPELEVGLDEDASTGHTPHVHSALYEEAKSKLMLPRHALHAAGLKFKHPRTGEEMIFESGLPDDLRSFFESLTGQRLKDFKTKRWGF